MIYPVKPAKSFIFGFTGLEPQRPFVKFIQANPPAGFLLLGENYQDSFQLKRLISELQIIGGKRCLLLIDQEPGRVQRFKNDFPMSRLPQEYLKAGGLEDFRIWCRDTAEIMAELGLNFNLAPVLDMCPFNKNYPVLNGRSFGDDPETVIQFGSTLIEEFRAFDILTCAKHFPGLGSAKFDPHEALSISDEIQERFLNYHWLPFKAAANDRVPFFMTTHLLASDLDPDNSATYSTTIVDHIRNTIGHSGPIISDDLYMQGSGLQGNIGDAVINSIAAGHTLLIISRDISIQSRAVEAVRNRCQIDDEFRRIVLENEKKIDSILG